MNWEESGEKGHSHTAGEAPQEVSPHWLAISIQPTHECFPVFCKGRAAGQKA